MSASCPRPVRRWLGLTLLVLAWFHASTVISSAADLVWRWSNPLPHGNNISGVAFRTNRFYVQVTDHGQLYTSTDLTRWEPRKTGTRLALRSASFLGDRLLVSGENGLILWADDPQEIQQVHLNTDSWLEGVAASPEVAVAVGDDGVIFRSTDGQNWTRMNVPFRNWLRGVIWGGGLFVAVGEQDGIFTSPDGLVWTARTVAGGKNANLNKGTWTGARFIVAGDAVGGEATVVIGEADGTSWSIAQPKNPATNDLITAVAEAPGSEIVAGTLEMWFFSTLPNTNWASLISLNPEDGPPPAVYLSSLWDGSKYLFGGRTGRTVSASRNLLSLNWSEFASPPRSWLFDLTTSSGFATNVTPVLAGSEVAYIASRTTNRFFVAAGDYATLMYSDTGVSWNPALPPLNAENRTYLGLAGNHDRLVAVGTAGLISVSPIAYEPIVSTQSLTNTSVTKTAEVIEVAVTNWINTLGLAWYPSTSPTDRDLQAACATESQIVIGGEGGFLATSTDGTNWTQRPSGTTAFLSGLEASPEGFVAVGDLGTILTSTDAVTWTQQSAPTDKWIYRVRKGGDGTWVAVGEEGVLLTSADRTNWTLRPTGLTNWLNDAEWVAGTWFVVGNQGTVLTSTNAITWNNDGIITGKSLYAAATLGERFITAGVDGIILRTRVTPFSTPVDLIRFPNSPPDQLFLFSGQTDQIFRLDRGASLLDREAGPQLEITSPDGTLLYFDPTPNDSNSQFFNSTNIN